MTRLYKRLKERNVAFTHVCEVGVYLPESSNILGFIREGIRTTLVEADPIIVGKIRQYFQGYSIQLHPVAVWDYDGLLQLSKAAASTFVTDLKTSPALENDGYRISEEKTFEVACKRFSSLDDGTIDLLSIDIEGSEWYVLKYLNSRPKVISIETHGKVYTNPFIREINAWMEQNHYLLWYKDSSDSVYVHRDSFAIKPIEKIALLYRDFRIRLRKQKYKLKSLLS